MSESEHEPNPDQQGDTDSTKDLAKHERPERGLIPDEDLPDDLRPSDDNPLAKDPDDSEEPSGGPAAGADKVAGMPDVGDPGAPA